jgi:hypothetical protein
MKYREAWERLPERFRKENNLKLYYVLYGGFDEVFAAFDEIRASRDLDKAYGETLDKIGANVGQFRLDEDDDLYRQLIKVRIIANLSLGNIPTINKVLSVLTKDVYLGLREAWDKKEYQNEPAKIVVNLSRSIENYPIELIERIKSAGVRVLTEVLKYYDSDLYVGGLRRRHMHMTYKPYEPTEINSKLDAYVAGYLINTVIESWPIQAHGNLVSKGEDGYLASDIGYIRGEMIE